MICLTGDLHHQSLGTGNQQHCPLSEIEVARRFLALLEEAQVKVTFFVSGRSFAEQWHELEPIANHPLVELGGHNWSCLTPTLLHRASKKLLGSYNGPAWWQWVDAVRTIRIIERRTGRRIRAWRNHMYMHGPHTERVLALAGIDVCSDSVRRDAMGPVPTRHGISDFPINVLPDHEHLYHAERTPEWVDAWHRRYGWRDDFGAESYPISEWVERVLSDLDRNEQRGALSCMIIHPITMYLCDEFAGFRRILERLAARRTLFVSEALAESRASQQPTEQL